MDLRSEIESLIGEYCDGTISVADDALSFSLERAHFIEYFHDLDKGPQQLADRLYDLFMELEQ